MNLNPNRFTYDSKSLTRGCLLALCLLLSTAAYCVKRVSLTVLHTNDTHGHLLPYSYPDLMAKDDEAYLMPFKKNIGGIARRATLIKRIRQEMKAKKTPVWAIDTGDFNDGTPFSTEYHGEADLEAMNAVGYDYGVFGNHEYNNPLTELKKLYASAKHKLVCANVTEKATGKSLFDPYVITKLNGIKIGMFGLVTKSAGNYRAAREGLDIQDEVESARQMVKTLRPKVDILFLLSHTGITVERRIAAEVKGIDVIVGGHSHTRLPYGELRWASDELPADRVNGTILVQAHEWGGELGRLDLIFKQDSKKRWSVERYRAQLLPITSAIPEDNQVAEAVNRYWNPIKTKFSEVLGTAAEDFSSFGNDNGEYNLFSDAFRETYNADFSFQNIGGVRAPFVKGPITFYDLATADPFDNTVVEFSLTGKQLKEQLSTYAPYVSGIKYRIVAGVLEEATINGQPIEDERVYKGVTNNYYADRGLKGVVEYKNNGIVRRDLLADYLRRKKTITPVYDNRRVLLNVEEIEYVNRLDNRR